MNTIIIMAAIALAIVALPALRGRTGGRKMGNGSILEKIKGGALVVDVRTPDEYRDENYPGAKNIPLAALQARMDELGPKDRAIVLYCASGARSAQAARLLKMAGYTDVTNAGGLYDMPRG